MNIEEYKQLMLFNILMSSKDLSAYKYAAVDDDGLLFVYKDLPRINNYITSNAWSCSTDKNLSSSYTVVSIMSTPENFMQTLIEL